MARIRLTTDIAAPPEVCFDLALNVDVQLSLDPSMRVVGGLRSGPFRLGDTVTWHARHFGVPWRMTSQIIEVDRPHRFVDEMLRGPFARWRHVHEFESVPTGTRMSDTVDFAAPLGPIGRVVDLMVLEQYMTRLLATRNQQLKRVAESATEKM